MDWQDFRKWCYDNKSKYYARFLCNAAKKWSHFTFSNEFVNFPNNRKKEDILKAITNLSRYIDIKYDTYFHDEFLHWIKRKEIRWKCKKPIQIPNEIPLENILLNIRNLAEEYRLFCTFALVSGLRTFECVRALNSHDKLCKDGIIEMYWDRGTKKSTVY